MNPFLHLNFDYPVLKDTFVLPPADEPEKGYWKYYQKIPVSDTIHSDIRRQFLKMNLFCQPTCLLFYAPPGAKLKPHKDGGGPNAWAINWALTPNRAEMIWYETNGEGEEKVAYKTTTPTVYTSYQDHELVEVCREEIQYPSIVRIGIPHSGYNHSKQGAWLLSLRFMTWLSWNQATELFKSFAKT